MGGVVDTSKIWKAPKRDEKAISAMQDLRHFVENFNKLPALSQRGGTFRMLCPTDIFTVSFDGFVIGYRVKDCIVCMRRQVFIRTPGYSIGDIPPEQRDPVINAICDVFLDRASPPELVILGPEQVRIDQDFVPFFQIEGNTGIVTPGKLG